MNFIVSKKKKKKIKTKSFDVLRKLFVCVCIVVIILKTKKKVFYLVKPNTMTTNKQILLYISDLIQKKTNKLHKERAFNHLVKLYFFSENKETQNKQQQRKETHTNMNFVTQSSIFLSRSFV